MLEEYNKIIDTIRETLSALPKNNKKNTVKYIEIVKEKKDEFDGYKLKIEEEIKRRRDSLSNNHQVNNTDNILSNMNILYDNIYLLTNYNSSYQKLGLDKIIYNISKYYKSNLESVNENILKAIKIFKDASINLTVNDFNYSMYANKYMMVVFSNKNDINSEIVKNSFQDIYWKCSDVLTHISLNFRYLYFKNKKYFDVYCVNLKDKFLGKRNKIDIINSYNSLKRQYDTLVDSDITRIVDKFKNKELNINDMEEEKINNNYKELINNIEYSEDIINDILSYKNSILEYMKYNSIKYIIDKLLELYKEHTGYKSNVKNQMKEINKLESKLFGINKKIDKASSGKKGLFSKKVSIDNSLIEVNNIIKELNTKYIELDKSLFKDKYFSLFNDSSSYYDLLELILNNYIYLIGIMKENNNEISIEDIDKEIDKIKELIYSPYNTIINNINIINDKDIKMIIYDKYKLANFNTSMDLFMDEAGMNHTLELIEKIMTNYYISKSYLKIEDIKFLCNIMEYNL